MDLSSEKNQIDIDDSANMDLKDFSWEDTDDYKLYGITEPSKNGKYTCLDFDWSMPIVANQGKCRFGEVAKTICPKFQYREELKPTYNDIFYWCVMYEGGRLDPNKGLWLCGNVGIGKTTLLKIIREYCKLCRPVDHRGFPYGFRMEHATEICAKYESDGYDGIKPFVENDGYKLAIDDLGVEDTRTMHFGNPLNVLENIFERRYILTEQEQSRGRVFFTHVTTNLSMEEVRDRYGIRVYDRVKDMFNVVDMRGKTFRGA